MDMSKRFVAQVSTDGDGNIEQVVALDNELLSVRRVNPDNTPEFVIERVALLRLCETSLEEGESIGRKFSNHRINVYLSYDEYKELI